MEQEPVPKPHRIKAAKSWYLDYSATVQTEASDADPRPKGTKVTGRVYSGPVDCPDCGRGLISRGGDMVCPNLLPALGIPVETGIVACGMKRDG